MIPTRHATAFHALGYVALVLLMATPGHVFAASQPEPILGTVAADFEPYLSAGQVVGCTLEWRNLLKEELNNDRLVALDVLLTFIVKGQQPSFSLKTRPSDAQQDGRGRLRTAPFSPVYAYPVFGNYSGAHREAFRYQCDGQGFCAAYTAPEALTAMIAALGSGSFQVWYQRAPSSLDVPSPTQLETGPSSPVHAFGACMMGMLNQAK
jgi:hypothetical protein